MERYDMAEFTVIVPLVPVIRGLSTCRAEIVWVPTVRSVALNV